MRDSGQMSRVDAACIETPDRVYSTATAPVRELFARYGRGREVCIWILQKEEDSGNLLFVYRAGRRKLLGVVAAGVAGKGNTQEVVVGGGGLVGDFSR